MTPEEQLKFKEMEGEIETLKSELKKLSNFSTIPFDTEKAFKDRFRISQYAVLGSSSKTVASETQAVNESGSSSYNVPKIFDGYRQMTDGGNVYYFPYYT